MPSGTRGTKHSACSWGSIKKTTGNTNRNSREPRETHQSVLDGPGGVLGAELGGAKDWIGTSEDGINGDPV